MLQYFSSVLAERVINNASKIWEVMPKFLQTRELLCHGFKGTWQITELAISVSKNCFELCMVSKYRILTSLSQNLWNVVTLQWLISTFMLISFFLLGFCLFICLFVWGFLFVWVFLPFALLFYQLGLKYYPNSVSSFQEE